MKRSWSIGLFIATLAASGGLSAQTPSSAAPAPAAPPARLSPPERFKQIDVNHDGKVTLEEFRAARAKELKDAAKTGNSTGAGAQGAPEPSTDETFRLIDVNHDGYITVDEFTNYFTALFRKRDAASSSGGTPK